MPIEIRELIIRASVPEQRDLEDHLELTLARLKADILEQCMEKIRQHHERSKER